MSARREDGRGSEDRGEDSREDTADGGQAQPASGSEEEGRHGSIGVLPALSGERSERRPRGNIWYDRHRVKRHQRGGIPESVTPVTDLLRDPGGKEEK